MLVTFTKREDVTNIEPKVIWSIKQYLVAGLAKIGYNHAEAYQNKYTKSVPECCLLIFLGVIAGETYYLIHNEHLGHGSEIPPYRYKDVHLEPRGRQRSIHCAFILCFYFATNNA